MKFNTINRVQTIFNPDQYLADPGLVNAAEVAFALRQPLLIMGEPGTGKTRFAYKLAYDLSHQNQNSGFYFRDKPLTFFTKTNSQARDLFYTYDALSQYQEANIRRDVSGELPKTIDFIELQALGKAIAMTNPQGIQHPQLIRNFGNTPWSSVVLIDEIDKAPRDFPNDILNEIENQEFYIRELDNICIQRDDNQHIITVMTSNSEKNLPDAFLRRCVFYHIPFPDNEKLLQIAQTQLGHATEFTEEFLRNLIERFGEVRRRAVRKPPATAELIAWLRILGVQNITDLHSKENQQRLRDNISILVKTKEDLDAVHGIF